jgi:hypothetical protein
MLLRKGPLLAELFAAVQTHSNYQVLKDALVLQLTLLSSLPVSNVIFRCSLYVLHVLLRTRQLPITAFNHLPWRASSMCVSFLPI